MSDLEGLDYAEMTTEELMEVLSAGAQVDLWLNDTIGYVVSIADVSIMLSGVLDAETINDLHDAVKDNGLSQMPDLREGIRTVADHGEFRLLERLLDARKRLMS